MLQTRHMQHPTISQYADTGPTCLCASLMCNITPEVTTTNFNVMRNHFPDQAFKNEVNALLQCYRRCTGRHTAKIRVES